MHFNDVQVRQRFHVWRRNYDVYLGRQQCAVINSPLLAWEFAVKDAEGGENCAAEVREQSGSC